MQCQIENCIVLMHSNASHDEIKILCNENSFFLNVIKFWIAINSNPENCK